MFKKTIEFTDYNGASVTEDLYFNLSPSEMIILERTTPGGYGNRLETLAAEAANDPMVMWDILEELLAKSYGVRSEDGTRFIKKAPDGHSLYEDFKETAAYEAMIIEMLTNSKVASDFVENVIPKDAIEKVKAAGAAAGAAAPMA